MRPTRRRRGFSQRFVGLFVDDVWRKLAALAIAILLWVWLEQRETAFQTYTYEIVTADLSAADEPLADGKLRVLFDRDAVLLPEGQRQSITFRGRRFDLPDGEVGPALQVVAAFRNESDSRAVATLSPSSIRAVTEDALPGSVRITSPSGAPTLTGQPRSQKQILLISSHVSAESLAAAGLPPNRFDLESATFVPATTSVSGPTTVLGRIYDGLNFLYVASRVEPSSTREAVVEVLLETEEPSVELGNALILRLPRIDRGVEILLPGVPVVLHEPESLQGRFAPRQRKVDIPIRAFGLLAGQLTGLEAEALQNWVTEHALLIARVPPDASGPDVITGPQLLMDSEYRGGRDFDVTTPLTIDFRPKNP